MLAGSAGIWLFYVQHQFEDAYWQPGDWDYADAALRGSSYLKLPKVLQFFTGNIGLHHVHHLNARIPNYNLQRAHDENEVFHDVPTLSFWTALETVKFKLWDEDSGKLELRAGTPHAAPGHGPHPSARRRVTPLRRRPDAPGRSVERDLAPDARAPGAVAFDSPGRGQIVDDLQAKPTGGSVVGLPDVGYEVRPGIGHGDPQPVLQCRALDGEDLGWAHVCVEHAVGHQLADDQRSITDARVGELPAEMRQHRRAGTGRGAGAAMNPHRDRALRL